MHDVVAHVDGAEERVQPAREPGEGGSALRAGAKGRDSLCPLGRIFFEPANEWKNVRARAFSRAAAGPVERGRARSRGFRVFARVGTPRPRVSGRGTHALSDTSSRNFMAVSSLISYPTRNAFRSRVLGTLQIFRYDSRVTSQDWLAPTALIVRQVRRGPEGIARPTRTTVRRKARTCVSVSDEEKKELPRFLASARFRAPKSAKCQSTEM